MKKLILALSIAALSFTVSAQEEAEDSTCSQLAGAAGKTMQLRQDGLEMASMYNLHVKNGSDLGIKLTIDAYKVPLFGTQKYKDEAIRKFKNKWFMACVSQ